MSLDRRTYQRARGGWSSQGRLLLDVTLSRDGSFRRWIINAGELPDYWSCRLLTPTSVTVSACFTEADMTARVTAWNAQIAAAKTNGWVEDGPWPAPPTAQRHHTGEQV
jgi:hypothetical protein